MKTNIAARIDGLGPSPYEVGVISPSGERRYGMVNGVEITFKNQPAILLLISDITNLKMTEQALSSANRKLTLLSSITRHDILNVITGLLLRLDLLLMEKEEETSDVEFTIQKLQEGLKQIQDMIEFTGLYHLIGADAPGWFKIKTIINMGKKDLNMSGIRVEYDLIDCEIFADPLIYKVIYTILENALRHAGETLSFIRISAKNDQDALQISIADDGIGVSVQDKEDIFKQGYGKNTGFGLYLAREVLSITGISISEVGKPGNGAEFVIIVPSGLFRISSDNAGNTEFYISS